MKKTKADLLMDNINMERDLMKYKKGLRLAKIAIDANTEIYSISGIRPVIEFRAYLEENNMKDI